MAEQMFDVTAKPDGEVAAAARSGKFVPRYGAMPGIPIAAVGFACTLLAMEGFRLSSVFWVGVDTSPATLAGAALSIGLLLLVAIAYRQSRFSSRWSLAIIVAIGILYSVTLMLELGQSVVGSSYPLVELAAQAVMDVFPVVLMFVWAAELFAFGAAAMFYIGGISLLVLALLNSLTALLKPDAALMFVALMPVLSVALLAYFREYTRTRCCYPAASSAQRANSPCPNDEGIPFANQLTGVSYPDCTLIVPADREPGGRRFYLVTLMISMACFAVLFGQIHTLWVQLQDNGTMSLVVQMGTAAGTAVAGVMAVLFVRFLWNRRCIELLKLLLLGTVLVALWLSSFSEGQWVFCYLLFLNITQKLVNLLIMISPFLVVEKSRYLWPWWLTCLSFEFGKGVSQLVNNHPGSDLFMVGSVVPLAVLFVCTMATALLGDGRHVMSTTAPAAAGVRGGEGAAGAADAGDGTDGTTPADISQPVDGEASGSAGSSDAAQPSPSLQEEEARKRQVNRWRGACTKVSQVYGLTARESEILLLLARGRTAATIAETLVIAPSTAKAHLRNIYAKLGVHTQQELIDLVESHIG